MKRQLTMLLVAIAIVVAGAGSPSPPLPTMVVASAKAQRERRPPPRNSDVSGQVATEAFVLPAGTILVLRMESKLDSARSRPSDRFVARLVEPVTSVSGQEVIPGGVAVEGFVEGVTPAQLRRRSGTIAVHFDLLRMPDGRGIPIEGVLTEADRGSRKPRVDDENQVVGGSTTKQSIVFIGGAAGAGAAIGAIAGGALLGAGVGAAAGAAAAWLGKGKEAVVEKGTRLGLELSRPLDLSLGSSGISRVDSRPLKKDAANREQFVRRSNDPESPQPEDARSPANSAPVSSSVESALPANGTAQELGTRIADKVEVLVADYANSIGAKRSPSGGYEFDKQGQPSSDSVELLFVLSNLVDSAQLLRGVLAGEANAETRRLGADRLATHAQEVDRRWSMVNPGSELERKWRALEVEIRQLVQASRI